ELARRLCRIFMIDEFGNRAVFGGSAPHRDDPHFRDRLLFYEYFHGDTGRGVGAAHQTGWTALVALLLHAYPSAGTVAATPPLSAEAVMPEPAGALNPAK
ncbi:MAG: hypothetical protein ACREFH_02540, partial [Stellaceae bacterium]